MKSIRTLFISACVASLASCSLLQPVKTPVVNHYVLHSLPRPVIKSSDKAITLLVTEPSAVSMFDTTQMLYSNRPNQMNSYTLNRWAKKPSQMIHPLIAHTLHQTRYFHAVVTPPFMGKYDYSLNTQILGLQQNLSCNTGTVKLMVKAQVIKHSTHRVLQEKLFTLQQRMYKRTPHSGAIASNVATQKLLRQLAQFTIRTIQRDS